VSLVESYLLLNGYFTVTEFQVQRRDPGIHVVPYAEL